MLHSVLLFVIDSVIWVHSASHHHVYFEYSKRNAIQTTTPPSDTWKKSDVFNM
jgi:hypothetical protein